MALLEKYFIEPFNATYEYNVVNTLVYALIAFGGLYLIHKLFQKRNIKINSALAIDLIPYIFLGALTRAYVDIDLIPKTFLSVSPGIYLTITAIFLIGLFLRRPRIIGTLALIFIPLKYGVPQLQNLNYLPKIIFILIATVWLSIILAKKLKQTWFNNKLTIFAYAGQLFDAVNTALILSLFGGFEKHVLPRFVIEQTGSPFSFIPLKVGIVIPILYVLNKSKEDEFSNLIVLAIFVLGFAQGLRNLIGVLI
jgi:uncharacterized membrane protein